MKEKILTIIKEACALEENMDENTTLESLSLDSLSFVEALVEIEEEFHIEFDIDELGIFNWEKIEDIIKNVEEKIHEKKQN